MASGEAVPQRWPGSHGRALLCPYEYEDPAFRRAGRLPNLRYGDQVRAVWVTRYDFQSDADITQIMQRSARSGFNTVFFQVRGNATTYYPSKLEPWSEAYDWQSPGFDPLMLAIQEAHSHNMALHAWMNVMPMWRGSEPPNNKDQMYWSHPEWSWYDRNGVRQPLNRGFYVSLNPCLPEARNHIVALCREIVSCYEIDGLHLDYIRFPNEPPVLHGKEYPHDKRTLELFQADTGSTVEEKPDLWDQWRCDCVTALLRDIHRTAKSLRPQLVLTAAVGAEQKQALSKFQDVGTWWKERLLDAVVPMNYTSCHRMFRKRVEREWLEVSRNRFVLPLSRLLRRLEPPHRDQKSRGPVQLVKDNASVEWSRLPEPAVVMGTSVEFGDSKLHQKQLALALQQFGHFSIFCYSSLFGQKRQELRQQSLLSYMRILADASNIFPPSLSDQGAHLHPFRARDTFAHPEEAFPYDQLHAYDRVPAGFAFKPAFKEETPQLLTWRQRRRGRRFSSGIDENNKFHRRTGRRKLLYKERKKELMTDDAVKKKKNDLLRDKVGSSFLDVEENISAYTYSGMDNWEAVKMLEGTIGEEKNSKTDVIEYGTPQVNFEQVLLDPTHAVVSQQSQSNSHRGSREVFLHATDSPIFPKGAPAGSYRAKRPVESPLCWISAFVSPHLHAGVSVKFQEALGRIRNIVWSK